MLLQQLAIKQGWSPWGTAVYLYYCCFFFSSFPLLFIRLELAICSVAPRSAICELFTSVKEKKNREKRCETFLNRLSASGRKPVDWVHKAKSFTFGTGGELGTVKSEVNMEEV